MTRHTDRKGQAATFSYDGLNRRTGGSYADGSASSFAYDAGGHLIQASESTSGTILNEYDALDRLLAQATGLGTVSYQYDALGRRTRMDAPGQSSVFYAYDPASRLTSITQAPLNPVAIEYDAGGRRTRLTLPNQVSTEYQYDAASRLTALIYRNALGPLGDLTYQYDKAGNRTRVGGPFARTLLPDPVDSATYDAANRQLQFGTTTLTYDANGNLTGDGQTTYAWDARNRLVALVGPVTGSFGYDPAGRRSMKDISGIATAFLYDGANPVQELREADVATLLTSFSIDEYLFRTDADGLRAFLVDALGSTLALADTDGSLATTYTYAPFGTTAVTGASTTNPFGFTAREHDAPSGLYYYRARYYHPRLQRFLSEDPLALLAGTPNYYEYATNSPTTSIDPLGLQTGGLGSSPLR